MDILSKILGTKKEVGKRRIQKEKERVPAEKKDKLASFLDEDCKNKCYMCPDCLKRLELIFKGDKK